MSNIPDRRFITDLKNNAALLEVIGEETKLWVESTSEDELYEALKPQTIHQCFYLMHSLLSRFILDAKASGRRSCRPPPHRFR